MGWSDGNLWDRCCWDRDARLWVEWPLRVWPRPYVAIFLIWREFDRQWLFWGLVLWRWACRGAFRMSNHGKDMTLRDGGWSLFDEGCCRASRNVKNFVHFITYSSFLWVDHDDYPLALSVHLVEAVTFLWCRGGSGRSSVCTSFGIYLWASFGSSRSTYRIAASSIKLQLLANSHLTYSRTNIQNHRFDLGFSP